MSSEVPRFPCSSVEYVTDDRGDSPKTDTTSFHKSSHPHQTHAYGSKGQWGIEFYRNYPDQ